MASTGTKVAGGTVAAIAVLAGAGFLLRDQLPFPAAAPDSSAVTVTQETPALAQQTDAPPETTAAPADTQAQTETTATAGGNSAEPVHAVVTVSESDYLYEGKKLSLEALLAELEQLPADAVIEIAEENAAQRAYKELTDALTERSLSYMTGAQ